MIRAPATQEHIYTRHDEGNRHENYDNEDLPRTPHHNGGLITRVIVATMLSHTTPLAVSLWLIDLLQTQKPFLVLAEAAQAIAPPTDRAHEVQAEAVKGGLGASCELRELGMAADAGPHAGKNTPAERLW